MCVVTINAQQYPKCACTIDFYKGSMVFTVLLLISFLRTPTMDLALSLIYTNYILA